MFSKLFLFLKFRTSVFRILDLVFEYTNFFIYLMLFKKRYKAIHSKEEGGLSAPYIFGQPTI